MTDVNDMTADELWEYAYGFHPDMEELDTAQDEILARLRERDAVKKLLEVWVTVGNGHTSREAMAIVSRALLDAMTAAREKKP